MYRLELELKILLRLISLNMHLIALTILLDSFPFYFFRLNLVALSHFCKVMTGKKRVSTAPLAHMHTLDIIKSGPDHGVHP